MLEETGQVVAISEPGVVLVRVQRQSACGSCQARAACGQGMMQMARPGRCHEVRALSDLALREGDHVVLGVSEEMLVRSALLVYLVPLLALIAGALLGQQMGAGEGASIALAGLLFAASWLYLYRYNRRNTGNRELVPVVLRMTNANQRIQKVVG